ncbi:secretin N-terminal domain-containing protein [Fusobacterium sp.]|uniref:secretin N-terminal domain-containing protein n=1 Tax=Fusobacterium sp. TaxID=68766 RepID=UPI0025C62491|nr:secretin N-terminal domain-containing protein [Fusobacterium sp.]
MSKRNLVLLILFFICYNIYGQFYDPLLKKSKLTSDLNLQGVTLGEALNIIGQENRVTILSSDEIKDTNLDLYFSEGESVEDILNSFIEMYNLKLSKSGNVFILSKRGEKINSIFAGKVLSSSSNSGVDGVKITLLNSFLQPVYSNYGGNFILSDIEPGVYLAKFEKKGYVTKGEIINISQGNSTLTVLLERDNTIINPQLHSQESGSYSKKSMINGLENLTENIYLHNLDCEEVKKLLKESFGDEISVSTLNKRNLIVISGRSEVVKASKELVDELDKDREQIRVDAQILDITDNLFETLGFNWIYSNNGKVEGDKGWNMGFLDKSSLGGLGNIYSSSINVVKQFNGGNDVLNLGINLLEATQDLVVSARPSILVLNGEEGSFKVTEEVIVGEEREENDNNDRVISTPIFKEAGIILKVTPNIGKDGWINLKVVIEVSNFKLKIDKEESEDSGTYNSEGGSKVGRSIETTVKIRDGETIFIGGLKKATVHNLDSKIPFFGTLPMINFLFKNQNISHEITDIYVKMKVNIVNNESDTFEKEEIHQRAQNIINRKIY